LTSVACLVTTPLILDFLIAEYMPDSFTMPTLRIAIEIGLCLLLPLLLGMGVLRRFPDYAGRFSTICVRGSLLGIALIAAGSIGAGRLNIGDTPTADLVTLLGFIIGLTVIGVGLTKAFGLAKQDNTAIEMEVVVRNINLGLLLKVSLFPLVVGEVNALADMVLLSLLLYGAWQLIMGFALIFWRRNSTKRTTQTVTSA
jgi:BASS family bile acid:Na+ symporter